MKTHKNISIFIPHAGCPYQCAFCNQRTITAQETLPHAEDVKKICSQAMQDIKDKSDTEIAFFGGSFTAIPEDYMLELLKSAQEFIGKNKFSGIRISTRPDCINPKILKLLKSYHVTSIELGAQSMSDKVLSANRRGHTAQDVVNASALIKESGFELGLQVMVGLYQSTWDDEFETREKICQIHPDTVRMYPVVILRNTRLAELYQSGAYQLFPFEDIVEFCASSMRIYQEDEEISVIKCGLHASEFVERDMLAGYYHPAFRELCESEIYKLRMEVEIACQAGEIPGYSRKSKLQKFEEYTKNRIFAVNPRCISKAVGHQKSNLRYFAEWYGITVKITGDDALELYQVKLLE